MTLKAAAATTFSPRTGSVAATASVVIVTLLPFRSSFHLTFANDWDTTCKILTSLRPLRPTLLSEQQTRKYSVASIAPCGHQRLIARPCASADDGATWEVFNPRRSSTYFGPAATNSSGDFLGWLLPRIVNDRQCRSTASGSYNHHQHLAITGATEVTIVIVTIMMIEPVKNIINSPFLAGLL